MKRNLANLANFGGNLANFGEFWRKFGEISDEIWRILAELHSGK